MCWSRQYFEYRPSRQTIEGLYELKRELLQLESAINPVIDICNELMRFHSGVIPKDVQVYFRDIADHIKRIDQAIHGMREMLLAAMQVHLTFETVRQNEVVKRLGRLGGDPGDTDYGIQLVRHEFPAHAGAGLAIQLSAGGRRCGSEQCAAVFALEKGRLAVILKYTGYALDYRPLLITKINGIFMTKRILYFLTPGENISPFDVTLAADAGFDMVVPLTKIEAKNIAAVVQDAIFCRPPKRFNDTGIFIGGRDVHMATDMFQSAKKAMVHPFEVGVFADPERRLHHFGECRRAGCQGS